MASEKESRTNTIVLITGGNTGIGLATAQALLAAPSNKSYTVVVTSRALERATAAVQGLHEDATLKSSFSTGSQVVPMQLDVDDEESIKALRQTIGEKFGRLDVLVNHAGTPPSFTPTSGCFSILAPSAPSRIIADFTLSSAVLLDFAVASGTMSTREASLKSFTTNVISIHILLEIHSQGYLV